MFTYSGRVASDSKQAISQPASHPFWAGLGPRHVSTTRAMCVFHLDYSSERNSDKECSMCQTDKCSCSEKQICFVSGKSPVTPCTKAFFHFACSSDSVQPNSLVAGASSLKRAYVFCSLFVYRIYEIPMLPLLLFWVRAQKACSING